ncbi:S-adenosyl-L-methionine-dependentmethyltransferases superfamily protein [Striga asiatica]|uniref:S-adenosyl-L-methionine-dependentmethyltransferases superfamily protein n=1 Tax=Striga asiatica TaxID=4170 RepID=A0A5A7Q9T7_STRAF|nr:S-adenosyl-L-methionine-dependentmethyltransferases superfamily protein [Striga asiatica]
MEGTPAREGTGGKWWRSDGGDGESGGRRWNCSTATTRVSLTHRHRSIVFRRQNLSAATIGCSPSPVDCAVTGRRRHPRRPRCPQSPSSSSVAHAVHRRYGSRLNHVSPLHTIHLLQHTASVDSHTTRSRCRTAVSVALCRSPPLHSIVTVGSRDFSSSSAAGLHSLCPPARRLDSVSRLDASSPSMSTYLHLRSSQRRNAVVLRRPPPHCFDFVRSRVATSVSRRVASPPSTAVFGRSCLIRHRDLREYRASATAGSRPPQPRADPHRGLQRQCPYRY